LHILFPVAERADEWVRKANTAPLFGGRSALDRMLAGQVSDLYVVRQYLDAQRGGKA
ncbi:MAG: MbcA/ParS/Xre antitoxin family protein, partial [Caldimonas sp.]